MRQLLPTLLVSLLCVFIGCDRDKPSSSSGPNDAAGPLPDHYGLFAIFDGKLKQLQAGDAPAEFPGSAEFIYFDKRVATIGSNVRFYVIPRALAGRNLPRRAGEFDFRSIPIDAQVKPIANQPEMVRIVAAEALDPGCYSLEDWADFFVDQKKLNENSTSIVGTWQAPYMLSTRTIRGSFVVTDPPGAATLRFSSKGTYTANITTGNDQLKEKGTWKMEGKNLITTTTASNDGRPAGTVDQVEVLQIDAITLVFKAAKEKGGTMKHSFTRIN